MVRWAIIGFSLVVILGVIWRVSEMARQDEEGTHERLNGHLRELVNPRIGEHQDRIVKNTGDATNLGFRSS